MKYLQKLTIQSRDKVEIDLSELIKIINSKSPGLHVSTPLSTYEDAVKVVKSTSTFNHYQFTIKEKGLIT
jgi:hypothetical protein